MDEPQDERQRPARAGRESGTERNPPVHGHSRGEDRRERVRRNPNYSGEALMKPLHPVDYPIEGLLQKRWSPRAFDPRPVEANKLASLLEAARWAPSCNNAQPWRYLIATKENPSEFDRMLSCLVEKNQQWARTAPVLMVSVAHTVFEYN